MYKRALFCLAIVLALGILGFAPGLYGADRALLVGVEKYWDDRVAPTPGSVEDAVKTAEFIASKFNFPSSSIKLLLNEKATSANIEKEFREWLIAGSESGERVFFFYAGHGSQLPDDNDDEEDGYDETIAPYDVNPRSGEHEIRDDLFDELIAKLVGRRAVLVFDCCHSGTISRGVPNISQFPRGGGVRYLPRPDQFEQLLPKTGARDAVGVASYVVQENTARLLTLDGFVDPTKVGNLPGVIVITAAAANQLAYPLKADGLYRGALSYLLADIQRESLVPLQRLKSLITSRMDDLHRSGRLGGDQQPQFEIFSSVPLDQQPLFASWEEAPLVALTNPLSPIQICLRTGEGKAAYRIGENVTYQITTDTAGYLYLIVFSQQAIATCIFPTQYDRDNWIPAGTHSFPRPGNVFPVQEPPGRDVVVALLSKERLKLGDKIEYTWGEVFGRLNLKELQEAVSKAARGVGSKGVRPPRNVRLAEHSADYADTKVRRDTRQVAVV